MGRPRLRPACPYVYTLCTQDGTPFYVGEGKGSRYFSSQQNHRQPDGRLPLVIVKECHSKSEAMAVEARIILTYGRRHEGGLLINKGPGGTRRDHNTSFSDDHKKKLSTAAKARMTDPAERQKAARGRTGKKNSQEHNDAIRRA